MRDTAREQGVQQQVVEGVSSVFDRQAQLRQRKPSQGEIAEQI